MSEIGLFKRDVDKITEMELLTSTLYDSLTTQEQDFMTSV